MLKFYTFIFVFLAVSGCAQPVSYHKILEDANEINRTYGVNEKEAVTLAKKFLITKGWGYRLRSLKPFKVVYRLYFIKEGQEVDLAKWPPKDFKLPVIESWAVYFNDKEGSLLGGVWIYKPFVIEVDARTGKILNAGLKI